MKIVESEETVVVKVKKEYISNDGKVFLSEKKCVGHEEYIEEQKQIKSNMTKFRKKFKFQIVDIYSKEYDDFFEYGLVYVNSVEELLADAIKCYKPYIHYGRKTELESPFGAIYPCWILIDKIDNNSSYRYTQPLKEVIDNFSKTLSYLNNIKV